MLTKEEIANLAHLYEISGQLDLANQIKEALKIQEEKEQKEKEHKEKERNKRKREKPGIQIGVGPRINDCGDTVTSQGKVLPHEGK